MNWDDDDYEKRGWCLVCFPFIINSFGTYLSFVFTKFPSQFRDTVGIKFDIRLKESEIFGLLIHVLDIGHLSF
jgi:hypothetical protein